eukprot:sb/3475164/
MLEDSEEDSPVQQAPGPSTNSQQKRSRTEPWTGYPFNPGQWRFKSMPKYTWSPQHQRLLSDLLVALSTTMKLWKSEYQKHSEQNTHHVDTDPISRYISLTTGGRTLVLTDSISKPKEDSISNPNLYPNP